MKILKNKSLWMKILIAILAVVVVAFVVPNVVNAAGDDGSGWGGKLLSSLMSLLVAIADGIMSIIQKAITNMDTVLYTISSGKSWWKVALLIVGTVAAVIAFVCTGGTLSLVLAGAGILLSLAAIGLPESNILFSLANNVSKSMLGDETMYLPAYTLTPYEIFSNDGNLFSVNFFDDTEIPTAGSNNSGNTNVTIQQQIKPVIQNWYVTLRNISLVGMLSVLVYIGIRITISSVAADKAKYKQMLLDWCVGICLLFVMHYIMAFSNIFVDKITDMLVAVNVSNNVSDNNGNSYTSVHNGVEGYFIGRNNDGTVNTDSTDLIKGAWKSLVEGDNGEENDNFKKYFFTESLSPAGSKDEAKILFWPAENFTVQARMNCQIVKTAEGTTKYEYVGFALIYVMLVIYTCIFLFVYIKRFLYMAFLTMIAPLIALTYPLDRIKDGTAQGFNFWMKEYMYNLLLQPLHMLLYMILIGSAMQFASTNPIYVIVCLGFFIPAEKLVRSMFDFKGQTPGAMPGMAAGALMMNGVNRLLGKGPRGGRPHEGGNDSVKGGSEEQSKIKTKSSDPYGDSELFNIKNSDKNTLDNGNENNMMPDNNKNNMQESDENNGRFDPKDDGDALLEAMGEWRKGTVKDGDGYLWSGDKRENNEDGEEGIDLNNNPELSQQDEANNNQELSPQDEVDDNRNVSQQMERPVPSRAGHYKNAIKGVVGTWNRGRKNRVKRYFRAAGRGAFGVMGAAAGMTVAGVASLATGDPSRIAQNMTVGAMGGYRLTSRIPENVVNSFQNAEAINSGRKAYYRDDPEGLQKASVKKIESNFLKDERNIQRLQNNLTSEQYKELMRKDGDGKVIDTYFKHGFNNPDDIIAAERFKNQQNVSRESAMNILDLSKKVGDIDGMSKKNQDDWEKTMAKNFMEKTGIKDEKSEVIKSNVAQARKYLTSMNKNKKNII